MRDRLKRSFWGVAIVFLLVDSCSGALLDRSRRGVDGNLGNMVQHFLQYDDQTQLDYVRYGLDLLEDGVNGSMGELADQEDRGQAQDRIFLGSVQVLHYIFCLPLYYGPSVVVFWQKYWARKTNE
jgi:hypothetical protein